MPYTPYGDMRTLLNKIKETDSELSEQQIRGFFKRLVQALSHLYKNKVIHMDLKLENVLVFKCDKTGELYPKLCDFGIFKKDKMTD